MQIKFATTTFQKGFIAAQICMHLPPSLPKRSVANKILQLYFCSPPNLANSAWNNIVFRAVWPWQKYLIKKMTAKYRLGRIALCRWISEGGLKFKLFGNFTFCILFKFKHAQCEINISRNVAFIAFLATFCWYPQHNCKCGWFECVRWKLGESVENVLV